MSAAVALRQALDSKPLWCDNPGCRHTETVPVFDSRGRRWWLCSDHTDRSFT